MAPFFALGNPLGSRLDLGRVVIWPLVGRDDPRVGTYRSLTHAQELELAEVRELGSGTAPEANVSFEELALPEEVEAPREEHSQREEPPQGQEPPQSQEPQQRQEPIQRQELVQRAVGGARVGALLVENRGELPLLLCAGTILKGGLQDRQVARDVVVPAHATQEVEAYCIERGRWRPDRKGVATAGKFEAQQAFTPREVRKNAQYRADQGAVWASVDHVNAKLGVTSETSALVEGLEREHEQRAEEDATLRRRIRDHLAAAGDGENGPLGFCVAVDGKLVQARGFATQRAFLDQLDAFAATLAHEVRLASEEGTTDRTIAEDEVAGALRRLSNAEVTDERALDPDGTAWRTHRGDAGDDHAELAVQVGEERVGLTWDWVFES